MGILTSAIGPVTYEDPWMLNWDLAVSEFNSASNGGLGEGTRPLIFVACDTFGEHLIHNLNHLTLGLGASAVLTAIPSDKLLSAFQHTRSDQYRQAGGREVFFLSTGSATKVLEDLRDDGLVWHLLGSPRQIAETTASLVRRVERYVRQQREAHFVATGIDEPSTPLRLTLITGDTLNLTEISNLLTAGDIDHPETNLEFNGELAVHQAAFRWLTIESQSSHVSPDIGPVVDELLLHPPHIVVGMATDELAAAISWVEARWLGGSPEARMRPYYVLGTGLFNNLTLLEVARNASLLKPPLYERVVGVNYAEAQDMRARSLYVDYQRRLLDWYGGGTLEAVLPSTENHYDAAYLLMYAYAAAGAAARDVAASELRDAFVTRVISDAPGAESVDVGPNAVPAALELLERPGHRMSLYGTMGQPIFDRATGVRSVPTSAWCVNYERGVATYAIDGLLYDSEGGDFYPPSGGVPACMDQY